MAKSDVSSLKHMRELISYAKDKLDLTKVIIERRGASAKFSGVYTYQDVEHKVEIDVTLNTTDSRAHTNGKADLVRAVNDLKDALGVPYVRGIAQIKKSTAPRPVVTVKKPAREKLTLFGKAKAVEAPDASPTRLDTDPMATLGKLFAQMHPVPSTHVLWTLEDGRWKEEAKFVSEDGIERRAITLLRMGKPVQIKWAK